MSSALIKKANYNLYLRWFLYAIVVSNIVILSIVFLYPRFSFMVHHWSASEREILLSEGSRDNPNTKRLREIYKLMYFLRDNSVENGVLYFINPQFSLAHAYKILLPRKIKFLDSQKLKEFTLLKTVEQRDSCYFVFRKEDTPDFCSEVIWDESGWGICRKMGCTQSSESML